MKYWPESHAEIDAQIRLKLGTEPQGLIVGLKSNTYYWVRVMAYNSAGSGPESEKFRGKVNYFLVRKRKYPMFEYADLYYFKIF